MPAALYPITEFTALTFKFPSRFISELFLMFANVLLITSLYTTDAETSTPSAAEVVCEKLLKNPVNLNFGKIASVTDVVIFWSATPVKSTPDEKEASCNG